MTEMAKHNRGKLGMRGNIDYLWARIRGNVPKRGPDFFVLGAARAGSTTLHHLLASHSDIFMPKKKELHYFNNDAVYSEDLHGYFPNFRGYRGEPIIGEVTPLYFEKGTRFLRSGEISFFNNEDSVTRIAKAIPEARMIISIRDPITRAQSIQYKNVMQGKVSTTIDEEIQLEMEGRSRLNLIYRNRYDIHFQHVLENFPREQLLVLIFEDWTTNLNGTMRQVADFLGVAPTNIIEDLPPINQRERYRKEASIALDPEVSMSPGIEKVFLENLEPMYPYLTELISQPLPWKRLKASL